MYVKQNIHNESNQPNGKQQAENEMQSYLTLIIQGNEDKLREYSQNPLKFWCSHSKSFPLLSKIAKEILVIPASNASAERIFSSGAYVMDHRYSLSTCSIRDICFLHSFYLN